VASNNKALARSNKRKPPAAAIQGTAARVPQSLSRSVLSRNPTGLNLLLSGAAMSKFDLRFNGVVILCVGIAAVLAAIFFFV
jgi:hypothetical protein